MLPYFWKTASSASLRRLVCLFCALVARAARPADVVDNRKFWTPTTTPDTTDNQDGEQSFFSSYLGVSSGKFKSTQLQLAFDLPPTPCATRSKVAHREIISREPKSSVRLSGNSLGRGFLLQRVPVACLLGGSLTLSFQFHDRHIPSKRLSYITHLFVCSVVTLHVFFSL